MDFQDDIPLDLATSAHAGTSHDPDKRGASERDGYASMLARDYAELLRLAITPEKRATLEEEFTRYREGYRKHYTAYLAARSRCMSTMITGGSNFPVRRQSKINNVADRRGAEALEFRKRALTAIRSALQPELRPIMAGDSDAVERLQTKLAEAEALQEKMRVVNATIRRHARAGRAAQFAALIALGLSHSIADALLEPDDLKRVGYADYLLTNNNANIHRMRSRLKTVSAAKSEELVQVEGEHAKLEDCPADNRIRIFFSGKPDADVRARLKGAGFRWTPSLGCWQAYRNERTRAVAEAESGAKVASVLRPLVPVPGGVEVDWDEVDRDERAMGNSEGSS